MCGVVQHTGYFTSEELKEKLTFLLQRIEVSTFLPAEPSNRKLSRGFSTNIDVRQGTALPTRCDLLVVLSKRIMASN